MNGKRYSDGRARKNGFYLALAVCLAAVAIAAWSTYDAVRSYTAGGEEEAVSRETAVSEAVSSSALETEEKAERDTDPEKPAKQTNGGLTSRTETSSAPAATPKPKPLPTPVPTPEPEPQEEMIPVTAPLYELTNEMIAPIQDGESGKDYSAGQPMYSKTMKDWRIHTGADYGCEANAEVRACANGQVKETRADAMLGNVIVIEHGDYVFSYCGVDENFRVAPGDIVTKGQVIGEVTAVPSEAADPPHLHLEARRDGVCMDPREIIGK